MAENFQDNVSYGQSTFAVSGDAVAVGSTNAGAKSVIFNNTGSQGHLAWQPNNNYTINLPNSGGVVQLTGQVPQAIQAGTQTATNGTIVFSNSNGFTFGMSNNSVITASYTVPSTANLISAINFSAGTTSNNLSALTFSNSNGISFGLNNSTITASYTVPTQTNQTAGLYAVGNTTGQSSSSTFDARTMSFSGAGIASVGYSAGNVIISVPSAGGNINFSAGTTSQNLNAITFSNFNGISFGLNGSTLTASVIQTNQTEGMYALGNTTGQSSSSTFDARTMSFSGGGNISLGYSNSALIISGSQSVQTQGLIQAISDGVNGVSSGTIVFTNANGVSFIVNGQTMSASIAPRKVFQLGPDSPWQTNFQISNASFSLQHFYPRADIIATQANFLMALSGMSNSTGALTLSLGAYTMAGSTMSLVSSGSRQITWTSGSQTTNSSVYGGISGTCYRTISLASWNFTAGDYMLGIWCRTTNNGT